MGARRVAKRIRRQRIRRRRRRAWVNRQVVANAGLKRSVGNTVGEVHFGRVQTSSWQGSTTPRVAGRGQHAEHPTLRVRAANAQPVGDSARTGRQPQQPSGGDEESLARRRQRYAAGAAALTQLHRQRPDPRGRPTSSTKMDGGCGVCDAYGDGNALFQLPQCGPAFATYRRKRSRTVSGHAGPFRTWFRQRRTGTSHCQRACGGTSLTRSGAAAARCSDCDALAIRKLAAVTLRR